MKRRKNNPVNFVLFFALLFVSGCAHYPVNDPLGQALAPKPVRFAPGDSQENTDSLFVVLTFSGGGTRAGALSYGVMKALRDTNIVWKGKKKSLLAEVDLISSVSGGSFTSAYYGLFGDKIFTEFEPKFLKRDLQRELLHKYLQPWTALKTLSPFYGRIDMAAEIYHQTIFEKKTFADLQARGGKPFLIINATNLYLGERFEFTPEQFALMGSDISKVQIARAVAASSAFPFLLSPVSFKNYGGDPAIERQEWLQNALQDYQLNRRRYQKAKNTLVYLDAKNHPYVHLMDGGLSDNIGLRTVIDSLGDSDHEGSLRQLLNQGRIERLLVIAVNARTAAPDNMDTKASPPGLKSVAMKTATVSMDNYSFESVEMIKEIAAAREQAQRAIEDCQDLVNEVAPGKVKLPKLAKKIKFDIVEVSFDAIKDQKERENFLSLPTSFTLAAQQVDDVVKKGEELLKGSEEFNRSLEGLKP